MVEIQGRDLVRVLELLLNHIGAREEVIEVKKDAFWSVHRGEAYDVHETPQALTIGLVSESWEHLEQMLSDPDQTVGYGFVWLSEVLRVIGDETNS